MNGEHGLANDSVKEFGTGKFHIARLTRGRAELSLKCRNAGITMDLVSCAAPITIGTIHKDFLIVDTQGVS